MGPEDHGPRKGPLSIFLYCFNPLIDVENIAQFLNFQFFSIVSVHSRVEVAPSIKSSFNFSLLFHEVNRAFEYLTVEGFQFFSIVSN